MVARGIKTSEGLCWAVAGVFICVLARTAELGSFREPGPGFMAFFAGLFLCAIGLVMIVSGAIAKGRREREKAGGERTFAHWGSLLYTVALLLFYVLFLETLGYIIATFLLMWGMAYDRAKRNLASSLLFSLLTVSASYLVFEIWLKCQLPTGLFPWW